MRKPVFFYPQIDYRSHPAFSALGVVPRDDDDKVEEMISAIDQQLDILHKTPFADDAAVTSAFHSSAGVAIDTLGAYFDATTPVERVRNLLKRSLADVKKELIDEAHIRNDRHRFNIRLPSAGADVLGALQANGMHASQLGPELKSRLQKLAAPVIERLRERARLDPANRVAESLPRYNDIGVLLDKFFREKGILQGLSAFFGSNVVFTGYSLEYSHSGQRWWQNCYAEAGLPTSDTAYMHYDHGCRNPKAIVALSEVSPENGPTGYILGSHKEPRSNFVHFLIKSIDLRFYDDYLKPDDGSTYYRPRFQREEYRREFLMLPRALQACSHFGEDIQNDLPLSQDLLKNEIRLTKDVGDCITFDGDYGIHRGALCRSGERLVFQVIFTIQPDPPRSVAIKNRLRAIARKWIKGE